MSLQDFIVAGKFKVGRKFGGGSFGDVHVGINLQTNQEVAIKMESQKAKSPQLMYEAKVYKTIGAVPGLPIVHWYGAEGDYNVMVVDLLGPSLTDLFKFCDSKFSLKTVLMLADQMITRVEQVHSRNYLHRDIKPQNFTMGLGKAANLVHIIDFGLAKKYRDPESADHIPKKNNCQLVGTARYSSLNTHLGIEQSRRDDLEAVGHVLFYFLRGNLPWQGYHDENIEKKYKKITEKKMDISVEQLGRHYPPEFVTFVNYCRTLEFEDQPDYSFPRMIFHELAWKENSDYDQIFDWYTISEEKRIDAEVRFGRKLEAESPDDFARKLRIEAEEKIERKEFVIDED